MPAKTNNNKAARGKNKRAGNVRLSAAQEREQLAKDLGLTSRQKAFVDELVDNKGISNTEAYIRTHSGANSREAAAVGASKSLSNSKVQIYKSKAVSKAKRRIVQLVDSSNESIALKSSQDILDRTEGKAIQRNETTSQVIEVKLDITGSRIGAHFVAPPIVAPLLDK